MRALGASRFELRTRFAVMRNKKAAGFIGYDTYELKDKEASWNRVKCMLAKYGEFSNVGGNKTAAFGQTKLCL